MRHSGVNYEVDFIHLMDLPFCLQTAHCAPFQEDLNFFFSGQQAGVNVIKLFSSSLALPANKLESV